MNHAQHTDDIAVALSCLKHDLRNIRGRIMQDIFAELLRLQKEGVPTTLTFHKTFITLYIHTDKVEMFTANKDNEQELLDVLLALEKTKGGSDLC